MPERAFRPLAWLRSLLDGAWLQWLMREHEDTWRDHPGYRGRAIAWQEAPANASDIILQATVGEALWQVRLNDFPDDPLFTLFADGRRILHFNDWPTEWHRP